MKKKLCFLYAICLSIACFCSPLYAASQVQEYLCEIGVKYYQQGKYDEALKEFEKALMIEPGYAPAIEYLEMIEQMQGVSQGPSAASAPPVVGPRKPQALVKPVRNKPLPIPKKTSINAEGLTEIVTLQREMIAARPVSDFPNEQKALPSRKDYTPAYISLDDTFIGLMQPISIPQGRTIVIVGNNIERCLVTQPHIVDIEQKSAREVWITGKEIGFTFVYVWDANGRWNLEFLGAFPIPEGPYLDDEKRQEEEQSGTFKLRYNMDWSSFEQGRRLTSLRRQFYSYQHYLQMTGATPYGNVDSSVIVRSLSRTTDVTSFTVGLTDGKIGNFKGFKLRGFDFSPGFTNLVYPGSTNLRGGMLYSPAFNNKLDYVVFWGREGGGRYGNLSPGLNKIKNSYVNGVDVNFTPAKNSKYGLTVVHGSGRDRPAYLERYMYDADASWKMGDLDMNYDIGFSGATFAHLFNTNYRKKDITFNWEIRNIEKNFFSIMGDSWRRGELGNLFSLYYSPRPELSVYNRLDVYQDRLFPSAENDNRWNEDYEGRVDYAPDPTTSYRMGYAFNNELGKLSERRYSSPSIGVSKSFSIIRNLGTNLDYRHSESKNYGNPAMDYTNEKISMGVRFSLIGEMYYFLNKEWNWMTEAYTHNRSFPEALEMGVDYNAQIFKTPFYQNFRLIYRDEEKSSSTLSFMSGEDYLEAYEELSFRPQPNTEAYCSARVRNVWADNPNTNKRIEADFHAGMRYTWDTGLRWDSVGDVDGYVFKDFNSDGLRQRDEVPVQGVKVWLGKGKSQTSDMFGYYRFKSVRASKAPVSIDASTLPEGFVLTVPLSQEVGIMQGRTARIDFGIASRSEITGFVFEDLDKNGQYNSSDKGVSGVVMRLEDGRKASTDAFGRYLFSNCAVGDHTVVLDLNTLPLEYLPQVPVTKKVTLYEGVTYVYNIPLKKIQQ